MKHLRLLFLVAYFFSFSEQEGIAQGEFHISGTTPLLYDGANVELSFINSSFSAINTTVVNGKFYITGKINQKYERAVFYLTKDHTLLDTEGFFIQADTMRIEITSPADKSDVHLYNFPFTEEEQDYKGSIKQFEDSLHGNFNLWQNVSRGITSGYNLDSLQKIVHSSQTQRLEKNINYIKAHPHSYFSLYLFDQKILNDLRMKVDSLTSIYKGFDAALKETALGKSINQTITEKRSLLLKNKLPDFSFFSNTRHFYKLSSFRKKNYVLLCFWDSWCVPCIKSIPLLQKFSEEYKKKGLQLISISIDKNETKWKASLKKLNIPWLQTCDLPKYIPGQRVQEVYHISYIPQYFLINKEGELIYHNFQLNDDNGLEILQNMLASLSY